MAGITDVDNELTTIEGDEQTLATAVQSVITDLEAKNGQGVDLTSELTRLQNIDAALKAVAQNATSNDPGPVATTPPADGDTPQS